MEYKTCNRCNVSQSKDNFYKNKNTKDGLINQCTSCLKKHREGKSEETKRMERLRKSSKKRNMSLDDVIKEDNLINEAKRLNMKYCYDCLRVLDKSSFGKLRISSDGLNTTCKECRSAVTRGYYSKNVESITNQKIEYYTNNKEKILVRQVKYVKRRSNEDAMFRLTINVRHRLKSYLKSIGVSPNLSKSTAEMIGCTPQELRDHIESKFVDDMSWDNYGYRGWHIDHIVPLSSAKTKEDVIRLNHHMNLQPMWGVDNMRKGSRTI
jgi:hypothetical protein